MWSPVFVTMVMTALCVSGAGETCLYGSSCEDETDSSMLLQTVEMAGSREKSQAKLTMQSSVPNSAFCQNITAARQSCHEAYASQGGRTYEASCMTHISDYCNSSFTNPCDFCKSVPGVSGYNTGCQYHLGIFFDKNSSCFGKNKADCDSFQFNDECCKISCPSL
eukprot:TRINITY_DN24569_c0_g1_i1.p1 TRINITY_DN24569_c0_g1~~TRINITY_DN24569_c0_g1_i1.p1  ORF type:complete len:165 (-),score=21.77 TRINITY_DN24569_c0_g1_i1:184-678(-)